MNLRSITFGLIVLVSISFGLVGCGKSKPLGHSISKHTEHHHGAGKKQHEKEHPYD
ncbi:MAG: hypothetical protein R8M38_05275 [Mariprofundaceae bacterium]